MKVSDVQEINENGFKTKLLIIEEADFYGDIMKEVADFLQTKVKCFYGRHVTVAVSVKFPVPKEYSDKILQAEKSTQEEVIDSQAVADVQAAIDRSTLCDEDKETLKKIASDVEAKP
jgi:hypothetical protein